jgi:cell division protein FtsI/penicillin-binding protein 2
MYFYLFKSEEVVNSTYNRRLWLQRNSILRGNIFDRNMKQLTRTIRINNSSQKIEYLGGAMFSHVLGYMDVKYGLTGLQSIYDKELMGKCGGNVLISSNLDVEKRGYSLRTTLDYKLQKTAYDLLGKNRGAVVILNPKTGEILAMVSKPSYDPNKLEENWKQISESKNSVLLNRAVSGMYPPGSIFKVITTASALENLEGVKSEKFADNGKLVFNDYESLSNYKGKALGEINLKEAFVHSSNVVFGKLGLQLGNKALKTTAEKFYFNKDIPADGIIIDNSIFPYLGKNEVGNIAQSAIGQSTVLATPIEMALTASTIANDGVMMKPMLVKEVLKGDKNVIRKIFPEINGVIISKENAAIIKEYMREVVEGGTGQAANIPGVKICGKTGTADHDDILNEQESAHSWFIGFAPYDNPQIAFAIIVEDGGQGGGKAAKIAAEVVKKSLNR